MILLLRDEAAQRVWRDRLIRLGCEVRPAPEARRRSHALRVEGAPPGAADEAARDPSVLAVLEDEARDARLARPSSPGTRVVELGEGVSVGPGCGLVVAAGPCAVEDEPALERIAARLVGAGVKLLRAGAYKPRSSPYSFRGLGEPGLAILERVARRHGLLSVTEVLAVEDVAAVAARADVIQVGARSMQSFALLEAVGRAGRPVLLKRHPGATYEEWLLAAEYVLAAGEKRVVLCERGIRTFSPARRYTLDLGAIPWAREATDLPIAVDPSHAAGCSRWVPTYARAAAAAGADLLLVEVHEDPACARSDAAQAVELEAFLALHEELHAIRAAGPISQRGVS